MFLQRVDKNDKVIDTITFNCQQNSGKNPSDDKLASEIKVNTTKVFGLKQQMIVAYQYHDFETQTVLTNTIPTYLLIEFLSGYYGVESDSIKLNKNKQTFTIDDEYKLLSQVDRQNKLGYYQNMSQLISLYVPIIKCFDNKLKQNIYVFKNTIDESEYINIFNQLYIGFYWYNGRQDIRKNFIQIQQGGTDKISKFYITCVKYNNKYKGMQYYPVKFYYDFMNVEDNSLTIQTVDNNLCQTFILKEEKLTIIQQLIVIETYMIYNPFNFILQEVLQKKQQYQIQLNYRNQTMKQMTKKMKDIKFMTIRKTHGNQYNVIGIKFDSDQDPQVRITFFPQTTYVQIQCLTDTVKTALFNFTILTNYFELDDPYIDFYEQVNGQWQIKKQFKKQYLDKYINKYILSKPDMSNIGTKEFNTKQLIYQQQDSQLEDLQIVDHISFGTDDRYQYQNLVNDIQKRPIQIPQLPDDIKNSIIEQNIQDINDPKSMAWMPFEGERITISSMQIKSVVQQNESQQKKLDSNKSDSNKSDSNKSDSNKSESKSNETDLINITGGKKGSPVYCNIQYDYSDFLRHQQTMIIDGFTIKNQTFKDIKNRYRCSNNFPYLLLGNTNGKDSISCAIDPMNPEGISLFEFYDVATRLFSDDDYLSYLRKFLYGRVSISATKFTQWASPGRCSECPLNLKKILGQDILFLSCMSNYRKDASDVQILLQEDLDYEWFESVFGQSYDSLFDGEIIYDYQDQQLYTTNLEGKNQSFWVQFFNHRKYLVIMDDVKLTSDKKHYYIPYYYKQKLYKIKQDFDVDYYSQRFNILGYISIDLCNINYIYTKQGLFPLQDSVRDLKLYEGIKFADKLPTFETVSQMIDDFDNFIINYNEDIIGTSYNGLTFYWKGVKFETEQKFTVGTYPLPYKLDLNPITIQFMYMNQICAYNIYQYIKQSKYIKNDLMKHDTEINMLKKILADPQLLIKIFDLQGKLLGRDSKRIVYSNGHSYIPILSQLTEEEILEGLEQINGQIPKTDGMKLDYIKNLSRFTKNKTLHYNKNFKEEIFVLNTSREYYSLM